MARSAEELSDIADMALLEIQEVHQGGKPPITRNALILRMQHVLEVPVEDARKAVDVMEGEYLSMIATQHPDAYIIAGRKVNPNYISQGF